MGLNSLHRALALYNSRRGQAPREVSSHRASCYLRLLGPAVQEKVKRRIIGSWAMAKLGTSLLQPPRKRRTVSSDILPPPIRGVNENHIVRLELNPASGKSQRI